MGEVEWMQEENQEEEFEEIALPEWKVGDDKERLVKETLEDKSLKEWREFADKEMRGYRWENDLLLKHWVESGTEKTKEVIVLPKSRRDEVIRMAHNTCGHLGGKKVIPIAVNKQSREIEQRKIAYDKGKKLREFKAGDLVLERIPGMGCKHQEAWRGPFEVMERLGEVTTEL